MNFALVGLLLTFTALSAGFQHRLWHPNSSWNSHLLRYHPRILRQSQECTEEGFFRDAEYCRKFYRCARLPSAVGTTKLTRYEFQCPAGTVFDEAIATCNYPQQMENPPTCRADETTSTTPATLPSFPPAQGGGGPQVPSTQQPQIPIIGVGSTTTAPASSSNNPLPGVPDFPLNPPPPPGNPTGSTPPPQFPGFPSNPSIPTSRPPAQFPTFPTQQPGSNPQFPTGFPTQSTSSPPRVFFLPSLSGQSVFYVPQNSNQRRAEPMITFGMH